ncbi:phospho-sugar mutase [Leptospira sp. 2 VSF19]|uniref:Phospho-sugar mutase n=1 Tax=Leptospira soteropolitanensis TaxID=2950025 RepID=A0AAW5VP05_9LEPT|nr:phospho-sugar mutase [Leptospira soteropolitanensis]MCW7493755.1 phospho-sugar mutase [Leptospira soteropolitanensis]MCW7501353.1 phospho-sugar mutase [Leptospira soteropolitanensis]MCW7523461.1 phospho-sugar mutase [Leptospira soteropolitanensis]MCW7527467.1 phospho-sugar mutase [Leptospira soteropolitanensis]MCW7531323.1 phospho-sugar mutase [Leptospira soteropolitanensis]
MLKPEDNILSWTKSPFSSEIQNEAKKAYEDWKLGMSSELVDSYAVPLTFGTGGIRGKIGNGIGKMNLYTVGRAALGFISYLRDTQKDPSIVIAYDSRRLSKEFAELSAGIGAKLGVKVYIFPKVTPTPLLSYAIRYYKASGGIVITASHNPPEYNGFKAYLADGGQLVPPDDSLIIGRISGIHDWSTIPLVKKTDKEYKKFVKPVGPIVFKTYLKELKQAGILSSVKPKTRNGLGIVYSPLHGTGGDYMKEMLNFFGYKSVFLVPEQKKPDGEFPTVKYPNPEEKEALALCEFHAKKKKAAIFIATDPDADRLGVGVRRPDGEYEYLNGNQIGSIMAAYLSERKKSKTKTYHLVKTIVTTDLQEAIAKKNGIKIKNVLTGFKYIAEEMKQIENKKNNIFLFGGEESYGYLPVPFVRDKDSLSSALLFVEILAEKGDLLSYLDTIYLKYGLYRESLYSLTLEGSSGQDKIKKSIETLRSENLIGKTIGGRKVVGVLDYETQKADGKAKASVFKGMPKSNVIQVELEGNAKLTIRPSGTEPKVKVYSSFASLKKPKKQSEISGLWDSLGKEISRAEIEFLQLTGLK